MNFRLTCAFALGISFSAAAAESTDELIRTAPPAGRDTMLLCNAELLSEQNRDPIVWKSLPRRRGRADLVCDNPNH